MSEESFKVFIVEDNAWYGEMLQHYVSMNPDYEVSLFANGGDCLKALYQRPSVVTVDYSLPDINGAQLLKKIKEFNPGIPVVIISGQEDINTVVDLLKEGADDYIVKDDDAQKKLWHALNRIKERADLKEEISVLREEVGKKYEFDKLIKGSSPAIQRVFALMDKATGMDITVSVIGETGTGKELVAKAVHYNSKRQKQSFVAVNMAAIPKELVESELFGHEKGAFTGAATRRIGKFEKANKGTLFLDEVAEMDMSMQSKLLRALQEREITRIGGNDAVKLDVRLIVATHKNLKEEVRQGNFREDLYYRLLGLTVELPPLRDRGKDVLLLARFFVDEFCKQNGVKPKKISDSAQEKLMKYHYPGNVRELRSIMEIAVVMAQEERIEADDISFNPTTTFSDFILEEKSLKEYNQEIIRHFMDKYEDNVMKVAEKLQIGKTKIYDMLKKGEL